MPEMDIDIPKLQQALLLLSAALTLIAIGAYTIKAVRGKFNAKKGSSSEMLTTFREMHEKGLLNDEEYRKVKTGMAGRMRAEVSRTDETV